METMNLLYQTREYITLGEFIKGLQKLDPDLKVGTDDTHYPLSILEYRGILSISFRPQAEIDWQTMDWEDYKVKYKEWC